MESVRNLGTGVGRILCASRILSGASWGNSPFSTRFLHSQLVPEESQPGNEKLSLSASCWLFPCSRKSRSFRSMGDSSADRPLLTLFLEG